MRHFLIPFVAIILFACNQSVSGQASNTFVLLTNGQLLEGYVIKSEAKYRIEFDNGAAITIDKSEVELHCENRQQAFAHLYSSIDLLDSNQVVGLTQWCIKNKLLDVAQLLRDKLDGSAIAASELRRLDQDIENLKYQLEQPARRAAAQQTETRQSQTQQQSSAEQNKYPSVAEIEAAIDTLPEKSFATYASSVQSALIYGCAAANCHDYRSSVMKISFYDRGSTVPRRMSQHNVYQVMQWVDRDAPLDSPILLAARTIHGGQEMAAWKEDSDNYRRLQNWITSIANPKPVPVKPLVTETHQPMPNNGQTVRNEPNLFTENSQDLTTGDMHPMVDPMQFAQPTQQAAPNLPVPPSPVDHLAELPQRPVDPFDPEIFNNKYGPQSVARPEVDQTDRQSQQHESRLPNLDLSGSHLPAASMPVLKIPETSMPVARMPETSMPVARIPATNLPPSIATQPEPTTPQGFRPLVEATQPPTQPKLQADLPPSRGGQFIPNRIVQPNTATAPEQLEVPERSAELPWIFQLPKQQGPRFKDFPK